MINRLITATCVALLITTAAVANAGDTFWSGASDNDVTNDANWDLGAPTGADRANFRSDGSSSDPDLGANDVTWDQIRFNNVAPTHLHGSGTITLNASASPAVFSEGGPAGPSIIDPNIVTTGPIQSNGGHDLTFNGSVSASNIEAYSSTSVYNGDVTVTGEFISSNSVIVFNGNYHKTTAGAGINNSGSDVTFTSLTSGDPAHPNGLDVLNLYGNHTIRNGQDDTFNDTRPWGRNGTVNSYNLNGFSDSLPFIGADSNCTMILRFGETSGANSLEWREAGFNGVLAAYQVEQFEVGLDSLLLGSVSAFGEGQLSQITVNGLPYSAMDPLDGEQYWNLDGNNYVQVLQSAVPEPSSALLLLLGVVCRSRRQPGAREAS